MKRKIFLIIFLLVALSALVHAGSGTFSGHTAPLLQEKWTAFESLNDGNDVSVSYLLVNKRKSKESDWTWKFRNDGSQKITSMKFDYIEDHGAFGANSKTVHDVFPGSLESKKVFGGWAAFLAESYTAPKIRITDIKRANSSGNNEAKERCKQKCEDDCRDACDGSLLCASRCSGWSECKSKC